MQSNANFGNKIAKFFEDYSQKEGVQKEVSKLDFKTFYQKHGALAKAIPFVHYGLFSVFSIGTAVFFLSEKVYSMLPLLWLSVVFSLLLLAAWEFGKSYLLGNLFKTYFYGLTHHGKHSVNVFALLAALLLLGGSVFLSVSGAQRAALKFADKTQEIEQAANSKADSIKRAFDSRIAFIESQIKEIDRQAAKKWKGLRTKEDNRLIMQFQESIARTESQKAEALDLIRSETKEMASKSLTKAEGTATVLVAVSTANELFIVVCVWFAWFFSYKTRYEKQTLASANKATDNDYTEYLLSLLYQSGLSFEFPNKPIPVTPQGAMGFAIPNKEKQKETPKEEPKNDKANGEGSTVKVDNPESSTLKVRNCKECGKEFTYKHWNAQYCGSQCKIKNWQERTGGKVRKRRKRKS